MKRISVAVSALLFAAVLFVSCNKNSPKEVAKTWLLDFYHMDYDGAKKLSTDDTKNLLAQFEQLSSMISDSSKKEMQKITITIKDEKEHGDTATVIYTTSDVPDKDQKIGLIKQNSKWLVQFSKDDTMGADPNAGDLQPDGADTTAPPANPGDSNAPTPDTVTH
jgi:Domain of unknown function (DUF4878)